MTEIEVHSTQELVAPNYKFRSEIPEEHCRNSDTKLRWLWNQRFGTLQSVWQNTQDGDTKAAATLCLNAAYVGDLTSINLLINRLEGGTMTDTEMLDFSVEPMPI